MVSHGYHAGIVVPAQGLPSIVLKGSQDNKVFLIPETSAGPDKTVDAIAEHGHGCAIAGVRPKHVCVGTPALARIELISRGGKRPAGPIKIDSRVCRKLGMQSDSQ